MPISPIFPVGGVTVEASTGGGDVDLTGLVQQDLLMVKDGQLVNSGVTIDGEGKVTIPNSILTAPSSIYLGKDLKLSNAAVGLGVELPTGARATVPMNVYDDNGTARATEIVTIDAKVTVPLVTGFDEELPTNIGYPYVVDSDYLLVGFRIKPLTAGSLRYQVFLGTDASGKELVDINFDILAADVGTTLTLEAEVADMIAYTGMEVYVQWSGTARLYGTTDTDAVSVSFGLQRPYFDAIVQPYITKTIATEEYVQALVAGINAAATWTDGLGFEIVPTLNGDGEFLVPDVNKYVAGVQANPALYGFIKINPNLEDGMYNIGFDVEVDATVSGLSSLMQGATTPTAALDFNNFSGYITNPTLSSYNAVVYKKGTKFVVSVYPKGVSLGAAAYTQSVNSNGFLGLSNTVENYICISPICSALTAPAVVSNITIEKLEV